LFIMRSSPGFPADTTDEGKIDMTNQSIPTSPQRPGSSGRRRGAIGLTGGLLAGTAAGFVFGMPALSSAAPGDVAVSAAVAQQVDEGDPAPEAAPDREPGERLRETLQALVDDGTITAEQADAVTAHMIENRPERGHGHGAGEHGDRGGPGMFARGVGSEVLTEVLGLDAAELREQLRDGATLAEIAEAEGVDPQAVVDALVGELEERISSAVEKGRIDQSEADEKLAEAEERITDMVDNGRPDRDTTDPED
jgi:hypothetical protein